MHKEPMHVSTAHAFTVPSIIVRHLQTLWAAVDYNKWIANYRWQFCYCFHWTEKHNSILPAQSTSEEAQCKKNRAKGHYACRAFFAHLSTKVQQVKPFSWAWLCNVQIFYAGSVTNMLAAHEVNLQPCDTWISVLQMLNEWVFNGCLKPNL